MTLACEDGQQMEAHKIILAASSPFFESILKRSQHSHPWIYLRGFRSNDLMAILDFLYFGEANVDQENLDSFLAIAEELQLKGLIAEELKLKGLIAGFSNEAVENQAMCTNVQKVNATKESSTKSTIYKSLVKNDTKPNPDDLKEESTGFASNGDLEALDERVKSLMEKSQKMVPNGPLMKTKAFICKVCGKEARPTQIRDHIEANHLDGIALPCDKILPISGEICGKIFSARRNLVKHKTKIH